MFNVATHSNMIQTPLPIPGREKNMKPVPSGNLT
jgi:hypothetical protein